MAKQRFQLQLPEGSGLTIGAYSHMINHYQECKGIAHPSDVVKELTHCDIIRYAIEMHDNIDHTPNLSPVIPKNENQLTFYCNFHKTDMAQNYMVVFIYKFDVPDDLPF